MKIKRFNRGYTMFVTEHEYKMLNRMVDSFDLDWDKLDSGERRSWSRRTGGGAYLRTDADLRTDEYISADEE